MGTSAGPNIVRDGLVFGYDTGYPAADNTQALTFNNGEPTTNLITNPLADSTTGFNRSGGTGTISYDSTEKALKWVQTDYSSWGTYLNIYPSFTGTLSTSAQYTFSCEYKTQNAFADSNIFHQLVQGNGGSPATTNLDISSDTYAEINGWKQYRVTFTPSNTGVSTAYNRFITGDRGSDTLTMYIKNIQFEQKSHQTPFVNGTRSSTQSLIDLKESTNIDVSNVSFDSTGQPEFDGTDDYFTTSGLSIGTPSSVSFETIIKFDGTLDSNDRKVFHWDKTGTTNGVAQIRKGTNNGRLMYQHHNGTTWYTLSVDDVVTADTYIHILVVHDSTTATMYKNGVQVGTGGVGNLEYTNAGEILIGYRAGSEYWKGDVPIFRVYNSALSVEQVKQNYNAYKKRFGL